MTGNLLAVHFSHLLGEKFIYTFIHSAHEAVLFSIMGDDVGGTDLQNRQNLTPQSTRGPSVLLVSATYNMAMTRYNRDHVIYRCRAIT